MATLEQWMTSLESFQDSHVDAAVTLQLHMEDMEKDRSRHNHLRLWGLPDATGPEDLAETAAVIFRTASPLTPRILTDRGCDLPAPSLHP